MKPQINLSALLLVAGGLAAATAPTTARASCAPTPTPSITPTESYRGDLSQGYDAAADYRVGAEALSAKNYVVAKRLFDRVSAARPGDAHIVYLAAVARVGLEDWKGAAKKFARAVKIEPGMIGAQQGLGIAYAKLADMEKAKAVMARLEDMAKSCGESCADAAELKLAIATVGALITG